jgi:hypothetical protein
VPGAVGRHRKSRRGGDHERHQSGSEGADAAEIRRLDELRLAALEEVIDDDLAAGRHRQVVGELEALVAEHPLSERLRGQLMLAPYRSGRQAEALEAYRRARTVLSVHHAEPRRPHAGHRGPRGRERGRYGDPDEATLAHPGEPLMGRRRAGVRAARHDRRGRRRIARGRG